MNQAFFLSYSKADGAEVAEKIHSYFNTKQIPTWWDHVDLKPTDVSWDDQIDDALADCRAIIFLMSQDSVQRHSVCRNEWSRAKNRYRKPVILLRLEGDVDVPFQLEGRQYIEFSGCTEDLGELVDHIKWMGTPEGQLHNVRYRIADAERDLKRAPDDKSRFRIEEDIAYLQNEAKLLNRIIADPTAEKVKIQDGIDRQIEIERKTESTPKALPGVKFINPPPAVAPEYFQDRFAETKMAVAFLNDKSKRLLQAVGRGGVGKTALVCRLLKGLETGLLPDDLGRVSTDGIIYLSGLGNHRISAAKIFSDLIRLLPLDRASALSDLYQEQSASIGKKFGELLNHFQQYRVVVLLDNFEDLIDPQSRTITDADLRSCLETILEAAHHCVKVIITTRVAAADLALIEPSRQKTFDMEEGLPSPYAENILKEMDADGRIGIKDAPNEQLAEVTKRTRGFPRALEALYAVLSADRDTTLDEILADSKQYLPENVVEKLVGEAYNRLEENSQKVMQALAVYGRPVTPNAVDFMLLPYCESIDSSIILKRLTNMFFVRREAGHYYLHPTDGRHALSKIPQSDVGASISYDLNSLRILGANYFSKIRKPTENWNSREDIEPVLAEFELRFSAGDYESAARIAHLVAFEYLRSWGEYTLMLSMNQRLRGCLDDLNLMEQCIGNEGHAYRCLGKVEEAITCFEKALSAARERGNQNSIATWLTNLGATCDYLGDTEKSMGYHWQAFEIDQTRNDLDGIAIGLHNLGGRLAEKGDIETALDFIEKSVDVARSLTSYRKQHYEFALGLRLGTKALVLIDAGRHADALAAAEESLTVAGYLKSPEVICRANYAKALAFALSDNLLSAELAIQDAQLFDYPRYMSQIQALHGIIALLRNEKRTARDKFFETIQVAEDMICWTSGAFAPTVSKSVAAAGLVALGDDSYEDVALDGFVTARRMNSFPGMIARTERLMGLLERFGKAEKLAAIRKLAITPIY